MEKTKKTYNEQLNEAGDAAFIMKKTITKDKKVKKAFVFVPDDSDKAALFARRFGYNRGCSRAADELGGSYCVIADDKVILYIKPDFKGADGEGLICISDYKNKGLTGRGLRLNEKYLEGAIDYIKTYHHKEKPQVMIDEELGYKADCFKTSAAPLTIDDLLDL